MSAVVVEKLAKLLYKIAEAERKVELARQSLASLREFNSTLAYKKLDKFKKNRISSSELEKFFLHNKISISKTEVDYLFRVVDRKKDGILDWDEFSTIFVSKNCSFHQTSNLNYNSPSKLPLNVEEKMAYVLVSELEQVKILEKAKIELYNNEYFHIQKTFNLIDLGKKGWIDLRDLYDFMKSELGYVTYEIAERVLRRIDTLEDKKIDFSEWVEAITPLRNLLNKELRSFGPNSYQMENKVDNSWKRELKLQNGFQTCGYEINVSRKESNFSMGDTKKRRQERNLCQPMASYNPHYFTNMVKKCTPKRKIIAKPSRTQSRKLTTSRSQSKSRRRRRRKKRRRKRRDKSKKRSRSKKYTTSSSGEYTYSSMSSFNRSETGNSRNNKKPRSLRRKKIGGLNVEKNRLSPEEAIHINARRTASKKHLHYEESRVIRCKNNNLKDSFIGRHHFEKTIKFVNNPEVVPDPIPVQKILLDNKRKMVISETVLKDLTTELNIDYQVGDEILTPSRGVINIDKKRRSNSLSRSHSRSKSRSRSRSNFNNKENKIIDSINLTARTLQKSKPDFLPTKRKLHYVSSSKENSAFLENNDCLIKIDTPNKPTQYLEQNKPNLRFDNSSSPINKIFNMQHPNLKSPESNYSPIVIRDNSRSKSRRKNSRSARRLRSTSPPSPITPRSSRTMTSDKTVANDQQILKELNFVEEEKDISSSLATLVQNFRLVQSKKYSLNQIGRFTPLALFNYLDNDQTGYLTVEKLFNFLSSMNPRFYLEDVSQMVKRHDLDGDNMLNYKDFFLMLTPYDAFYRNEYLADEEKMKKGSIPPCRGLDREILKSLSDLFQCLLVTEKNDDIIRDVIGPYFYSKMVKLSGGSNSLSKQTLIDFFYDKGVIMKHRELDGLIERYNFTFGGKLDIREGGMASSSPVIRYFAEANVGKYDCTLRSHDFDISRSDPMENIGKIRRY